MIIINGKAYKKQHYVPRCFLSEGYSDDSLHGAGEEDEVCGGGDMSICKIVITQAILDNLTAQEKASPRLRCNLDLRNSPEDGSQRMLNAIELTPGGPDFLVNVPTGHPTRSLSVWIRI